MLWCKQEAERLGLKNKDLWGGLIFDEMTIQVHTNCKLHMIKISTYH